MVHLVLLVIIAFFPFSALLGCGASFYGEARPKAEVWTASSSDSTVSGSKRGQKQASVQPTQAIPIEQYPEWKGIKVGQTTRGEIESLFGRGKLSKGWVLYQVDTIPAAIAFDDNHVVRSIKVIPPVEMNEQAAVAAYGKPDRERRSDDFLRIWEYDRTGMTVQFAPDNTTVASVEYRQPTTSVLRAKAETTEALLPSRQPLTDIPERIASVEAVLRRSGQGFSWVGADQEYGQAQQLYSLINQQWPIVTDLDMQRYLSGVMDRLVTVIPKAPFPWTIRVIDASTLNAMNVGGGIIFINSGLFKHLDSEAQLAYVIAHEMGHQLKRHLASIQTKQQIARLLIGAAALATAGAGHPDAARAINDLGTLAAGATLASFSRSHEIEADQIGLHILYEAGYDPREAEKAVQKFIELRSLYGPDMPLFSTHPDPETRLANIQTWISTLGEVDSSERIITTHEFAEFKDVYRY